VALKVVIHPAWRVSSSRAAAAGPGSAVVVIAVPLQLALL